MKLGSVFLVAILLSVVGNAAQQADFVLVKKAQEKMFLFSEGNPIGVYDVKFGANPVGHKQEEGDERTPEGQYVIDQKKSDSASFKALHISYPNDNDRKAAAARGVEPGGAIMIHGQRNGLGWLSFLVQRFNWTDGCIAVSNHDMDEIWELVPENTPIEIRK